MKLTSAKSTPPAASDPLQDPIHRLSQLGADRLAAELVELAQFDPLAARRLELLAVDGEPDKLAEVLRTHLKDLKRDADSIRIQSDDNDFADRLEEIRSAVERRVGPLDPSLALDLLDEAFIIDKPLMESCDEGWKLSMVFEDLCKLWLQIAGSLAPEMDTETRRERLLKRDDYGVRSWLRPS